MKFKSDVDIHKVVVSVCIMAYNHEKYIAKALDSVLMQQGNFKLEILLGEDGSSDTTATIVRDYAQRYPKIIRAFFHDPADKLFINGRQTGRRNFIHNLTHARGNYIALLDGDDCWTDAKKLDKQIRFLEDNKEYVACCHSAICVDSLGNSTGDFLQHNIGDKEYFDFDIYDILKKNPIPSLSVVFRNPHFKKLPDWFYKTEMADWPLHILNARLGKVRYFSENMASYRLHDCGAWADFRADPRLVLQAEISVWSLISKDHEYVGYLKYIRFLIDTNYKKIIKLNLKNNMYNEAILNLAKRNKDKNQIFDFYSAKTMLKIVKKYIKTRIAKH